MVYLCGYVRELLLYTILIGNTWHYSFYKLTILLSEDTYMSAGFSVAIPCE